MDKLSDYLPVKLVTCSCGFKITRNNAEYVGVQETSERLKHNLLMFNCPACHTTISYKVEKEKSNEKK